MRVIYTEPCFKGKDKMGHGYERYEREVYCVWKENRNTD